MIVADCGRASPGTPAAPLIQAADVLLIVTTADAAALAHLHARLGALRRLNPQARLLLTGPRGPWPPAEISATLQAPVAGRLPHDPAGASALRGHRVRRGPGTRWRAPARLPLLTAAADTAARLASLLVTSRARARPRSGRRPPAASPGARRGRGRASPRSPGAGQRPGRRLRPGEDRQVRGRR